MCSILMIVLYSKKLMGVEQIQACNLFISCELMQNLIWQDIICTHQINTKCRLMGGLTPERAIHLQVHAKQLLFSLLLAFRIYLLKRGGVGLM